jgi:hypothetical protein
MSNVRPTRGHSENNGRDRKGIVDDNAFFALNDFPFFVRVASVVFTGDSASSLVAGGGRFNAFSTASSG